MDSVKNLDAPVPDDTQPLCPSGGICRYAQELEQLRRELETLRQDVRTDALTGLFNYRRFSELLVEEMERARRNRLSLALLMVDLDHFKWVNDRFGHEVGNVVLQQVAAVLRDGVRRIDAVCRYGGEELALILPGALMSRALIVAERLRHAIAGESFAPDGIPLSITASFGVAVFPGPGVMDPASIIRLADAALYQAKSTGRNRVCHAPLPPFAQVTADEKRALLG